MTVQRIPPRRFPGVFALACAATLAAAPGDARAQDWQYGANVHGRFPGVEGETRFPVPPGGGTGASVDAGKIIDALVLACMAGFEARNGRVGVRADFIQFDLSG